MRERGTFSEKQIQSITAKSLKAGHHFAPTTEEEVPQARGHEVHCPPAGEVVRIYVGTNVAIAKNIMMWQGPGCEGKRFFTRCKHVSYKALKYGKTSISCLSGDQLWQIFLWSQ